MKTRERKNYSSRVIATFVSAFALVISLAIPLESAHALPSLTSMRVNGIYVSQASGGYSVSGQLSWNPTFDIGPVALVGNIGGTLLNTSFSTQFVALNYQAFVQFSLIPLISLELGGGMETWFNNGGSAPILSGALVAHIPLLFFKTVFAGYSSFMLPSNTTSEFRVGVGLSL